MRSLQRGQPWWGEVWRRNEMQWGGCDSVRGGSLVGRRLSEGEGSLLGGGGSMRGRGLGREGAFSSRRGPEVSFLCLDGEHLRAGTLSLPF